LFSVDLKKPRSPARLLVPTCRSQPLRSTEQNAARTTDAQTPVF
ncbi:hypothetical protein CEXT_105701, partial [Caerostris extrusa]